MKRIAAIALLLCGCAGPNAGTGGWTRDGASQADFDLDRRQCQAQGASNPNAPSIQAADLYISCMRGRGWRRGAQEKDQNQPEGRGRRCGLDAGGYFSCGFN